MQLILLVLTHKHVLHFTSYFCQITLLHPEGFSVYPSDHYACIFRIVPLGYCWRKKSNVWKYSFEKQIYFLNKFSVTSLLLPVNVCRLVLSNSVNRQLQRLVGNQVSQLPTGNIYLYLKRHMKCKYLSCMMNLAMTSHLQFM